MDKPISFIFDWYKLSKDQKISLKDKKIISIKQLINNSSNLRIEKTTDLFKLFEDDDYDIYLFKKLIKDIQNQKSLFGTISSDFVKQYNDLSDNLLERVGSLFLCEQKNNKIFISTTKQYFDIYLNILINSGIVYTEPQISGRVNSTFLRKNKQERFQELFRDNYKLVSFDFKACQPSILNSFLQIFPEKDFYTGLANALNIPRSEAKDLALKKYVWGPIKHDSLSKIYEWRAQLHDKVIKNNGVYVMKNGKTIFLEDMDESELLNRYCQAAEAQMIHNVSKKIIDNLELNKSYLAAIVYDELIVCFSEDELDKIDDIKNLILEETENKLEINMEII